MKAKRKYRITNDLYVFMMVLHIIMGIFINRIPGFSKLYFTLVCAFFILPLLDKHIQKAPRNACLLWEQL